MKYGLDDVRNALERASARHTAAIVAAGGVAKALLREIGVEVESSVVSDGPRGDDRRGAGRARHGRRRRRGARAAASRPASAPMRRRRSGSTRGSRGRSWARRRSRASRSATGSRSPSCAAPRPTTRSSATRAATSRETNRAGGIEAGVSNGEEIVVRAAMKPLPTLMKPLRSADLETGEPAEALVERSDVAAVEALAVVAEACVAFELAARRAGEVRRRRARGLRRRLARLRGADPVVGALGRHLALVGFMGAGKSTVGARVAERDRAAVRRPRRLIERRHGPIPELFERGEPEFRRSRRRSLAEALAGPDVGDRARRRRRPLAAQPRAAAGRGRSRSTSTSASRRPGSGCAARTARWRGARTSSESSTSRGSRLRGGGRRRRRAMTTTSCSRRSASAVDAVVSVATAPRRSSRDERVSSSCTRSGSTRQVHRLPAGEAGEVPRRRRAALERADDRPRRHDRRPRRRLDDRCRRLRRGDLPARVPLDRRPDDAHRPGRRRDRRQDGDQHRRRARTSPARSTSRGPSSSTRAS